MEKRKALADHSCDFSWGNCGLAFSKIALTPMYTSTSMMYAVSKETTLTSLADLQIGSQLTQDYKVIITSRPVLEEVIGDLDLNISYEILKSKISINNPADTRILGDHGITIRIRRWQRPS